jgi:hypothetical protein
MRAAWVAIFLFGCTASREVLPRLEAGAEGPSRRKYSFCPTKIDVYGGPNVLLSGNGGPTQPPSSLPDGASTPGTAEYDNSLASELRDLLMQDPDLRPIFGTNWRVRSCASPRGTLLQLSETRPLDSCGADTPSGLGQLAAMCTNDPAPVLLISAENVDDRCHGGGVDSREPDDPSTYADHFKRRLEAFLDVRKPQLALIGAQTEWIPSPFSGAGQQNGGGNPPSGPDTSACLWRRSDWNAAGVRAWADDLSNLMDAVPISDLHDQFKLHHLCCGPLGLPCDVSWYVPPTLQGLPTALNPLGAAVMIQFWETQLKNVLLANDFTCDLDAGTP